MTYKEIHTLSRHAQLLEGVSSLLSWDQETYMPPAAVAVRGEQIEAMAEITHQERTSDRFARVLGELIDLSTGEILAKELSAAEKAALVEWRNDYRKASVLPSSFVKEFAKLTSQAIDVWRLARQEDSFMRFAPYLDRILQMNRQKADYRGYKEHLYDALLDDYEPGVTTAQVKTLFSRLQPAITDLVKKIPSTDDSCLHGSFSEAKQLQFGHELLEAMGYDQKRGRLDLSTHPFSSSAHPTDSRVTTRVHKDFVFSSISTVLHEGGHSLYEMGLPVEQFGSPLGQALSLGMHESQSRWWETRIGRSKSFWHHFLPKLQKIFPGKLDVNLETFYRAINKVQPSLIRVEADEVTYSLHVILRFELEVELLENSLSVRDLPEAWNAKMKKYLGVTPTNNREGCLQDIHWAMGSFGYFPTYTLGNLYASHLFTAFEKAHPDWETRVAAGELAFIREWLHDAVHQHGRRYGSLELLKNVTGHPFSEKAYLDYLGKKYLTL